jgi:hypothetical protein
MSESTTSLKGGMGRSINDELHIDGILFVRKVVFYASASICSRDAGQAKTVLHH